MIRLRRLETQELDGPTGRTHGILVGFDIDNRESSQELVSALAEQFKLQWMISPPNTSLLVASVIGDFDPDAFSEAWQLKMTQDPALSHLIAQLRRAPLLHGTRDGRIVSETSLLLHLA
jgi:hypothetical protein